MLGWRSSQSHQTVDLAPGRATGVQISHPAHFTRFARVQCKHVMHFVYIARCNNGTYYTGITWSLKKRIQQHNAGIKTPLRKSELPVKLVYWEKFNTIREAAKREKEIKGWTRKKKERLISSLH